jgi:hypothetical protein
MSTAPDMLFEFGGVPVGRGAYHYAGWWSDNDNGNVYFVDFDEGTTQATGKNNMGAPAKHLQKAIDTAGTDATIYVRPRAFASGTYGEDPQQITPYSGDAENFHIDKAKKNMSIIGCGKGLGTASAHKCWLGGYSGLVTPVIEVRAPGCVIENLRSQPSGTATSGIFYSANDGSTFDGGNTTFINNDFHDANLTGAIKLEATWQMSIVGNRFMNCDIGILATASYSEPTFVQVWNNLFVALTTEVSADFYSTGGVKRFLAYNNYHAAGQPALAGGPTKYYAFGAASTGAIMNCYFGVMDTTDTNLFTLNGVLQSGNHSSEGLITTS